MDLGERLKAVVWFRADSTGTVRRFCDHLTTRPAARNSRLFAGFGYFVTARASRASTSTT